MPTALESQSLNHQTFREVPVVYFCLNIQFLWSLDFFFFFCKAPVRHSETETALSTDLTVDDSTRQKSLPATPLPRRHCSDSE